MIRTRPNRSKVKQIRVTVLGCGRLYGQMAPDRIPALIEEYVKLAQEDEDEG
jgi:hypothetical protein